MTDGFWILVTPNAQRTFVSIHSDPKVRIITAITLQLPHYILPHRHRLILSVFEETHFTLKDTLLLSPQPDSYESPEHRICVSLPFSYFISRPGSKFTGCEQGVEGGFCVLIWMSTDDDDGK